MLKCDVVLEQTLGHVSHGQNLQRLMPEIPGFEPTFLPIEYEVHGWPRHIPGYGNWTIRAGVRARRALHRRNHSREAIFVHTQVPAVLLGRAMTSVPTVVSLDATPKQFDELGEQYAHSVSSERAEQWKAALNRRCFQRAAHLVTWASWTKQSLIDDYGINASKVTVISPGVDLEQWRPARSVGGNDDVLRILFVGGDLRRKGGDALIAAFRRLRQDLGPRQIELRLVTSTAVVDEPGIVVRRGLKPNSPDLIAEYEQADIFCLPTLGDCLPMVLAEAAATGLPLVATDVGAIAEIVQTGVTGELVRANDATALEAALRRLASDTELRARYGHAARRMAETRHDARANATRIVEIIRRAVEVGGDQRHARAT
jgi:glycosyltransferase involved in cell wall biosynthesis